MKIDKKNKRMYLKIVPSIMTMVIIMLLFSTVNKAETVQPVYVSPRVIEALNYDLELEWGSYIQYMKHGWEVENNPLVDSKFFKKMADDESRHADVLGQRIAKMGGVPTKRVSPVIEGGDVKKMLQDDLAKTDAIIASYKQHVQIAIEEGDTESQEILKDILADEEKLRDKLRDILGITI